MPAGSAGALAHRVWADLRRDPAELDALAPLPEVPLPARLDVSGLAAASVAAASLAAATAGRGDRAGDAAGGAAGDGASGAAGDAAAVRLDGGRIATAFTSERWFRLDGRAPDVWAPLSGFRRAADGWVRTHANYPHHAAALVSGLGLPGDAGAEQVDAAIAVRTADEVAEAVTRAGGVCVAVRPEQPDVDAGLRESPLVELLRDGGPARGRIRARADGRPLVGLRVLDLTRVIAGPVGTRALAMLGADVLRVDSPGLPEPEWQHLDTGTGKRSTLLDLHDRGDRARFDELLADADAIVLGYRPTALARLGLDPRELVARHPRLVVGQLSAWGFGADEADRRGFDSIVQAASGIARIEGDADRPGALPAQALDHATGYLLAAAVISLLDGRGDARIARLSLRRTAAELLGMPRSTEPASVPALSDEVAAGHLESHLAGELGVRVPAPAVAFAGAPEGWPAGPHRWGSDAPTWAE